MTFFLISMLLNFISTGFHTNKTTGQYFTSNLQATLGGLTSKTSGDLEAMGNLPNSQQVIYQTSHKFQNTAAI